MKTILAAVDFSPVTAAVISAAAELASAVEGRIVILHVNQAPPSLIDCAAGMTYPVIMSRVPPQPAEGEGAAGLIPEGEREARARLGNLAHALTGVEVETSLVTGDPADEILSVARERSAGFIVMGLHSHNSLYELLVGSTAHGVLKKAPCQVLFVPAAKSIAPALEVPALAGM